MTTRSSWTMAKFTGLNGGPVFIDLHQVAAVTEATSAPRKEIGFDAEPALPGVPIGARVILVSGTALFTREAAETVFDEVRRAHLESPPVASKIRVGDAPIGDTPKGTIA